MKTYTTVSSPLGDTIRFDFRPDCNLLIFTSFNPMRRMQFIDQLEMLDLIIEYASSVHTYDDFTGSITLKLKTGYDKQYVIECITAAFEREFDAFL